MLVIQYTGRLIYFVGRVSHAQSHMSIVVVGSINTDLIIQVPRFAGRDETVLGEGGYTVSQGGKGANQAVAAIAGGLPVHMVGKVGNDAFGDDALAGLRAAGVLCDYVQRSDTHSTGLATIFLDPEARNSITVAPGANAQITLKDIEDAGELISSADVVMMQLEIPVDACRRAAELARAGGALVMLDPAPAPLQTLDFLHLVDYLTPNELEAEALTGIALIDEQYARQNAQALLEMGPGNIAITLGSRGSYMANSSGHFKIEARPVDAVDTTGAGDAFCGFLATALAKGLGFRQAAEIASAAASLSVTRAGARTNHIDWEKVLGFMQA